MSAIDDLVEVIRQIGRAARKYAESEEQAGKDVEDTAIDDLLTDLPTPDDVTSIIAGGAAIAGVTILPLEDLFERLVGNLPRTLEKDVLESFEDVDLGDKDDLSKALTEASGAAAEDVAAGLVLIEVLRRTDVIELEPYEELLAQFFLASSFDDVYGRELAGFLEEGVDPAIAQKVNADARSTQADLQDFVEANLRMKGKAGRAETRGAPPENPLDGGLSEADLGYLPDPDTYGLIGGQERLLELAGLEAREPEEIIEEPIQYGIPVPKSVVQTEADLAGMPENAKRVYTEVIDQLPKSENLIQEYTRLTEFTFRLREGVQEARFSPETAQRVIQPELLDLLEDAIPQRELQDDDRTAEQVASDAAGELGRNFELLDSIPGEPPSLGDLQSFHEKGVISSVEFNRLYDRFGGLAEFKVDYLEESIIDKGPEQIVRQEALGRITTTDAILQLTQLGFSRPEITQLLDGADPEAIITSRITGDPEDTGIPLQTVAEIGETRSAQLRLVGIENAQDVANASVEDLRAAASISVQEANEAIRSAQFLVEQAEDSG